MQLVFVTARRPSTSCLLLSTVATTTRQKQTIQHEKGIEGGREGEGGKWKGSLYAVGVWFQSLVIM